MKRHSKSSPIPKECPTPDLQLFKDSKSHKFVQLVFFIATLAAMLCTHMYTRAEVPRSDLCQRQCKTNACFLMNRRNWAQVKVGRSGDSASYINPLSRRPCHLPPTQDVDVQVVHRLAASGSMIQYDQLKREQNQKEAIP